MCLDDMGSIWVIKILQAHLLRAFVANSKIDAIYALYPESFCDKNLAIRKVFAFSDSAHVTQISSGSFVILHVTLQATQTCLSPH